MQKHIKNFISICILTCNYTFSQNLIPNPGFEEHNEDSVFYWIQPQKPYYHFEYIPKETFKPHSGFCINGICMRDNDENENFHVKLKETLIKNKSYYLSMYVRLRTISSCKINSIDWFFSKNDSLSKSILSYHKLKPHVKFELPADSTQFQWLLLENTYIANGTEKFLTIGHFPSDTVIKNYLKKKDSLNLKYNQLRDNLYNNKKKVDTDTDFRRKINEIVAAESKIANKNSTATQYFFDDFCISLLNEDGTHYCESNIQNMKVGLTTEIKDIFFGAGNAELTAGSFPRLESLLQFLIDYPSVEIQINGHTDNQGNYLENKKLSEERAKSVVEYLVSKGILRNRLSYMGFGSDMPIFINETEEGRAKNRRVEFTIKKR